MQEQLILVDNTDTEIGTEEKLAAHKKGLLHRAFSIFIFNSNNNELLLQQRALSKYHSGGLWSNTCCGHPRPQESTLDAAHRRLGEEMGFDCVMQEHLSFVYKVELNNNLTEYEFLHVFTGKHDHDPKLNPEEAMDFKWITMELLLKDITENPQTYTEWFKMCIPKIIQHGLHEQKSF